MNQKKAIATMSALAQPVRLAAMIALTRAGSAGMSVNEIATAAGGVLHNSMSVHLAVLARAGLVKGAKSGRETIYHANPASLSSLGAFISGLTSA